MMIRRMKSILLSITEHNDALCLVQIPMHESGNHLFVLAYHRVAEVDSPLARCLFDLMTTSPCQFEQQMKLLSSCFHPMTDENVLGQPYLSLSTPMGAVMLSAGNWLRW
jgi:hypothetical protein